MPTKNPRINVVLEDHLYKQVKYLAEKDGVSLSTKVRDLLHDVMETQEDIYLAQITEQRETSWSDSDSLSHDDIWK